MSLNVGWETDWVDVARGRDK